MDHAENPRRPTDSLLRGGPIRLAEGTGLALLRARLRGQRVTSGRPSAFGNPLPEHDRASGADSGSSFTGSIAGHQPYIAVQLFQMDRETGLVEGLFQPPDQGIIFAL